MPQNSAQILIQNIIRIYIFTLATNTTWSQFEEAIQMFLRYHRPPIFTLAISISHHPPWLILTITLQSLRAVLQDHVRIEGPFIELYLSGLNMMVPIFWSVCCVL